MSIMGLKPGQKRRLAAEQAVYRKFNNFRECNDECIRYAQMHCLDVTFNNYCVQQYIGCQTNLSFRRLKVLAAVLGVTNYSELDEVFTAPAHRGEGDFWVGDAGHRIKDIDIYSLH